MLESRAVTQFPLNDQEILLRHLHKTARDYVAEYQAAPGRDRRPDLGRVMSLPPEFADLEPFADWCLETEAERYAKRLASSMDELQAFYDAAFPRLEAMPGLPRRAPARRAARRRHAACCGSATR